MFITAHANAINLRGVELFKRTETIGAWLSETSLGQYR